LEEQREAIKKRLTEAAERMEEWGYDAWQIETHVNKELITVDAELSFVLPPHESVDEALIHLQEAFEPPDGQWRFSIGLVENPSSSPVLTPEQKQAYLRAGQHQFQTWYGYRFPDVAQAGAEMAENIAEFGYPEPSHIWMRCNWEPIPSLQRRDQRGFRQPQIRRKPTKR
jgi:hypothetical protein